ncbi:DNA translocase FtsK [Halobacillus shinanisalinarum]|uniref:DNA translocase FtsK n=1 Tax=Halobacillus shinanisalinarum TaxID=2932258 RepID=A0ABY4H0V1_9BACI|nr:DNA translocase FtsK [Halobacillus shinanisalinarum]UOQ93272.1 DNA translocase FtsK [Halobacillus shinanisalinarum]
MAKKKKTKNKSRKKRSAWKEQVKLELIGLLFLFIAVFGSGASVISDGAIPEGLEHFWQFIFGVWYFVASLFFLITGIYLMVKRKWPYFLHKRMIGLFFIFTSLLLFTHVETLADDLQNGTGSVVGLTWDRLIGVMADEAPITSIGGGLVGAFLLLITYYLFSSIGAIIVSIFLFLVGTMFVTERSIGDLLAKIGAKLKEMYIHAREQYKTDKESKKTVRKQPKDEAASTVDVIENNQTDIEEEYPEPIIQDFTEQAYQKPQENEPKASDAQEEQALEKSVSTAELENPDYKLPGMDLLDEPTSSPQSQGRSHIQATVRKLEKTFQSFGVKAKVTKVHVGPAVTKYEVYPDVGVKVSKIVNLNDDLALALAAKDIRIEAPIPGKSAVGIEVPNTEVSMVSLREVLETGRAKPDAKLNFALGRDISGEAVMAELNKMPHLLVAGATGSGKSVCINGIITSVLMRAKPHEVKMMMIDPKKVELNVYNGIPHLLAPVVTDPKKASRALMKVVSEMERRYDLFSDSGTRNIEGYNEYIRKHNKENEDDQPFLPYIIVLVDELADLMMVASNDVEDAITRLAQMARAAGIHLIIATQRPSVDVITGVIKANIPSRIAFSVSSQTDSRTILDSGGAEKLLGRGDMLFTPVGSGKPTRVQGAFLSDEEVERVVDFCVEQQKAQYQEEMIPEEESEVKQEVDDDLYPDAVQMVIEMQSASVSMIQRRFRVGYTRAARLIDAMEDNGIVGPYEGSKPRNVLVSEIKEEQSS